MQQLSSLKNVLIRAKYSNKKDHYNKRWTKARYTCCDFIKESSFHTFKTRGNTFFLKGDITCENSELVYFVTCSRCNEEGFEKTGDEKTEVQGYHIFQPQYHQLNARNTFELVEKENSKYFLSSNYIQTIDI